MSEPDHVSAPGWTRRASSRQRTISTLWFAAIMVGAALYADRGWIVACIVFTTVGNLVDERLIYHLRRYVDALERSRDMKVTVTTGVACLSLTTTPIVGDRWCHLTRDHDGPHQSGAHRWG